ncbi:glycine zipper 2TM domain-containing protein [Oleiagrimonas sp. C23AA]|uniref:glycine zipper 2TM domain-containing protein n=1 Tax=Oleiagrimonas sp. C23AA TaxID=2719047 RepID=UPI00142341EE|nr:glycine zipper 2TM domain-containing protein [Oleiagrimonas sp. C23AA]NII10223.1 glycine zipper 2TM domain-containing protein [Oleiagrimonas sp. C23AA]
MRKTVLSLLGLMFISVTAAAQQGPPPPPPGAVGDNVHYGWADVLRVDPVYRTVRVERPVQDCYDQRVVHQDRGNSTAGTILGAVVGGVLGNTIGKGDGRRAATVAGAVAGGAIGNRASSGDRSYETTRTRCDDVTAVRHERRVDGYDVEYRYRGQVFMSRLNYDPGERLRVRVSVTPAD